MIGLLATFEGMQQTLQTLIEKWQLNLKIGLFTNDGEPQPWWTIENITPASFDGYPGLLTVSYWRTPVKVGEFYASNVETYTWTKTGGSIGEYIQGAYVTTEDGESLMWVDKFAKPITVVFDGDEVRYQPQISVGSLLLVKGNTE